MAFPIDSPLPVFYDRNGSVLDAGFVYIGTANTNPETNPIAVYWDAAQTQPAPQPLRTVRGFIARNGAPANLYVTGDYSIVVRDRNRQLVLNEPSSSASLLLDYSVDRSVGTIALLRALPIPSVTGNRTVAVTVLSHTAGIGKGGGQFRWDAASVVADDNGRTINPTGNVGAGRWIRIEPRITVEQYGAVGDGVTNDSTAIQAVLTQYNAGPLVTEIDFESGAYKCNTGLTLNSTFCTMRGEALLDFSSAPAVVGLTITASTSPDGGNHFGRKAKVSGFRLQGPGARAADGSIAISLSGPSGTTPGPMLERVMVFNWDIGHQHGDRAYISGAYHCEIYRTRTAISMPVAADAHERVTYTDCTIYNNNTVAVIANNNSGYLHMIACSLDYNDSICTMTGGRMLLTNCHIESGQANYGANTPINLSGDGTTFSMDGGVLLMANTAPHLYPAFATIGSGSNCLLKPDFAHNLRSAISGPSNTSYWFTGAGDGVVSYGWTFASSQMPRALSTNFGYLNDGGLEANSIATDLRFLSSDTAAITNQYTGTNISMAISAAQARTGTYSLAITKAGGTGSNASAVIAAIPVTAQQKVGGTYFLRKPGTSTGTLFLQWFWARIEIRSGVPQVVRQATANTTNYVLPAGDSGWVQPFSIIPNTATTTAPEWATHAVMQFNGGSWNSVGETIYIDDMVLDVVG